MIATIGKARAIVASLHIPAIGPWVADVTLDDDTKVDGKVTFQFGSMTCEGTVSPDFGGAFLAKRSVRIVAGGGGWGKVLAPKNYHNDGGVHARAVADDAAKDAGEKIDRFEPAADMVGRDYVRRSIAASRILEDAIGHGSWWVGIGGATIVAPSRSTSVATCDVLSYSPESRMAIVGADDPIAVGVGSILKSDRLEGEQVVREVDWQMRDGKLRGYCWCGATSSGSRLASAMKAVVARLDHERIFGKWRYRVATMNDNRVDLQAVSKAAGLPDTLPVDMVPGVAGAWAKLAEGAEVLVEFVEGDPTMPIVTGMTPRPWSGGDGGGHVPKELQFEGETIYIHKNNASPAACIGDTVHVLMPPMVLNGTITMPSGPMPVVGAVVSPLGYTLGTIESGSPHVKIGRG